MMISEQDSLLELSQLIPDAFVIQLEEMSEKKIVLMILFYCSTSSVTWRNDDGRKNATDEIQATTGLGLVGLHRPEGSCGCGFRRRIKIKNPLPSNQRYRRTSSMAVRVRRRCITIIH